MSSIDECVTDQRLESPPESGNGVACPNQRSLSAAHETELSVGSGLSPETIAKAGLYTEQRGKRVAALLNRDGEVAFVRQQLRDSLIIPYLDCNGDPTGYVRAKPLKPFRKHGGDTKPAKYLGPTGVPTQAYFPPDVWPAIDNPNASMGLTEGEKKALAATQAGHACIGLGGVWNFGVDGKLSPELARIHWLGHPVWIGFDADPPDKKAAIVNVRKAMLKLAALLTEAGAIVRVVTLPLGPAGEDGKPTKMGLDDFIVANGPAALTELIAKAEAPKGQAKKKKKSDLELASASSADPAEEAGALLEATGINGVPKYVFWRDEVHEWSRAYRPLRASELRARVVRYLNEWYCRVTSGVVSNVIEQIRAQAEIDSRAEAPRWIGEPPMKANGDYWPSDGLLSARNGLLDLKAFANGEPDYLTPPTPQYFAQSAVSYDVEPDAPFPEQWLKFIDEILGSGDEYDLLQEWFGHCLTPDKRFQKILLIVGPTRSGKGTIGRVLREVIGRDNVAAPTLSDLGGRFGLWELVNKPLAIIGDAHVGGRADQNAIVDRLLAISGNDPQSVDRKNLPPVTCVPPTRLMICANELPRLNESSGAFANRMLVIRLTESFLGREDRGLFDRLLGELPGILRWSIAGWARLQKRGRFVQPERSKEVIGQLEELSSPITAFLRDRCEVGEARRVWVDELFRAWEEWAKDSGFQPGSKNGFGQRLFSAEPRVRKTKRQIDRDRRQEYIGIGLRSILA